ncbi:hypothetical protein VTK73DRAFT_2783 [Phialemonium thermophilum]|uniref:Macro domain-containing protein n=1 Tax=Phialemonium thermophilum TaxID=223376 RepID=A0ABR3X2V8_9PEZI
MAIIQASEIPTLSLLYKLHKLHPAPPGAKPPPTRDGPSEIPPPSKVLNDRIGVLRGDITTLAVDAIVNAANSSLLGGGGVDGAIHRAAGHQLLDACARLGGCHTGSAKITDGFKLPCRKVIHAVGPVYDYLNNGESERLLSSCYSTSLELALQNGCRSVAFSAISTGVYGYPSKEAAPVALAAVRKFLTEKDKEGRIQKVVFVTFEMKDVEAYNEFLPLYFPPVPEDGAPSEGAPGAKGQEVTAADAQSEAEAKAIANELPSAPTSDPSNPEHVEKKSRS